MSIREHLLARVRPLVDRLADDLVTIIDEHIESRLARMTEAFDVALSAAASELGALDENAPPTTRVVRSPRKSAPTPVIVVDEIAPSSVVLVHHGAKPANATLPDEPSVATAKLAKNGKAWPSCKLCGRIGVTARTHPLHGDKPSSGTISPLKPEASAPQHDHRLPPRTASRESRPQPARVERPASDADEEGAAVAGELMPPREDVPTFVGPKRNRRRNPARPRKATLSLKSISSRTERAANAGEISQAEIVDIAATRPRTRGDCVDGPRPCPLVGCSANLYLDVNPLNGSITLNRPELEPWEMTESCALDVADRGEHTLEQVGALANLTRARIRQIEIVAFHKLKQVRAIADAAEAGA